MIDISTKEVLMQYLKDKGIIQKSCSVHYCEDGVSCIVAYVDYPGKPIIVKQALSQLKTKDTWLCDPNRMNIEYEANRIYHNYAPEYTPETYFCDQKNYIYGREAVPDGCNMWKDDLMNGIVDQNIAQQVIDTLSIIHNRCSIDREVKEIFTNKDIFYSLRISPYFEFTASKHPQIQEFAQEVTLDMMENSITLVHGDYSPKNIMIDGTNIKVLDFEVAHYGHPAFDLAFLSNHFILKAIKFSSDNKKYLDVLDFMVERYFYQLAYMDKKEFEDTYIRTLSIMLLARVDGKSPVEYLVDEEEKKEIVRSISLKAIIHRFSTYKELRQCVRCHLEKEV